MDAEPELPRADATCHLLDRAAAGDPEAFGDRMESRIRQMRHEGTSYVFATQDTGSIPVGISRFLTTRFVFNLGTRENIEDLEQVAPEFRGMSLLGMKPGHCLVQANTSTQGLFARPREIRVRPRVTARRRLPIRSCSRARSETAPARATPPAWPCRQMDWCSTWPRILPIRLRSSISRRAG